MLARCVTRTSFAGHSSMAAKVDDELTSNVITSCGRATLWPRLIAPGRSSIERVARAYIWDVQQAVGSIQEFMRGMDASSYADSVLVCSAAERHFEIIGQALNKLSKVSPELAGQVANLHEIIGVRNILIHGYASIDHARVWMIAVELVPELKCVIADMLWKLG